MSKKLIVAYIAFFILTPHIFGQELNPVFVGHTGTNGKQGDCYVLTQKGTGSGAAAVWYDVEIDFKEDFEMIFDAYLGDDDNGADGMALVFKKDYDATEIGGAGGGMGYRNIDNSLILEFDTFHGNSDPGGSDNDHISLMANGDANDHLISRVFQPADDLENGAYHEIKFSWDAASGLIKVFKDCVLMITYDVYDNGGDLIRETIGDGGDNTIAYFGFTAGILMDCGRHTAARTYLCNKFLFKVSVMAWYVSMASSGGRSIRQYGLLGWA